MGIWFLRADVDMVDDEPSSDADRARARPAGDPTARTEQETLGLPIGDFALDDAMPPEGGSTYTPMSIGAGEIGRNLDDLDDEPGEYHPMSLYEPTDKLGGEVEVVAAARHQPWVAVDLDGTILEAPSPGTSDGPEFQSFGAVIDGATSALAELIALGWRVSIYTARLSGVDDATAIRYARQIADYLNEQGVPYSDVWVGRKPKAHVFIDDRAIRFDGDWAAILPAIVSPGHEPSGHEAAGVIDTTESSSAVDDTGTLRRDISVPRPPDREKMLY